VSEHFIPQGRFPPASGDTRLTGGGPRTHKGLDDGLRPGVKKVVNAEGQKTSAWRGSGKATRKLAVSTLSGRNSMMING
jgi:hypothetical protein